MHTAVAVYHQTTPTVLNCTVYSIGSATSRMSNVNRFHVQVAPRQSKHDSPPGSSDRLQTSSRQTPPTRTKCCREASRVRPGEGDLCDGCPRRTNGSTRLLFCVVDSALSGDLDPSHVLQALAGRHTAGTGMANDGTHDERTDYRPHTPQDSGSECCPRGPRLSHSRSPLLFIRPSLKSV